MKKYIAAAAIILFGASALFAQTVKGVALQKDTALWTLNAEGIMDYAKKDLTPGTAVEVYTGTEKDSQGRFRPETIETGYSTAKDKKAKLVFAKVSYKGKDYYAIANRVAAYQDAAVVIGDAATYLTLNPADVRKTSLKPGTTVAIGKKLYTKGIAFYEVSYYDSAAYRIRIGYIREEKVSSSKDDITGMQVIKQALELKDTAKRDQMLESVKRLKVSDKVLDYLEAKIREAKESSDMLSQGTSTFYGASGYLVINSNDGSRVNVRDVPGTDGGNVIMKLDDGTKISCDRYTNKKQTIEGITEGWFYVSYIRDDDLTPVDGWIFGGFTASDYSGDDE